MDPAALTNSERKVLETEMIEELYPGVHSTKIPYYDLN